MYRDSSVRTRFMILEKPGLSLWGKHEFSMTRSGVRTRSFALGKRTAEKTKKYIHNKYSRHLYSPNRKRLP